MWERERKRELLECSGVDEVLEKKRKKKSEDRAPDEVLEKKSEDRDKGNVWRRKKEEKRRRKETCGWKKRDKGEIK